LISELERLRQENDRLQSDAMLAADALAENARLRQMLGSEPRGAWNLRLARVVAREPTTWWRTVTIDYGTRDGAAPNQPVLNREGLVGRVAAVGYSHSQVALVGDADCGVAALVTETRDNGIIPGGQSTLNAGLVEWTALQLSPRVLAGQSVVTSGLGGVFPKNLKIGQVLDTRTERSGVTTTARIKLAANLDHLEEVFILRIQGTVTNSTATELHGSQPPAAR
jgi:rod shape-determining protein MreC